MRRTRSRLLTALIGAGFTAGLVLSPAVSAQPAPPPAPAPAPAPAPPPPAAPGAAELPPGDPAAARVAAPFNPFAPPPPTIPADTPAGQNPLPYTGEPVFLPPSFNPVNGALVGVAKPIIIKFQRPIANRQLAQDAIHISSNPAVPGRFYWIDDSEVRWRPQDFWPAHTTVDIDAGGAKSSFRVGESQVATIDDKTKKMEIMINGELVKTMPVSLGKEGYQTKNGTYYVLEKFKDMVMDSSTYGVPVDSENGYRVKVKDAVRIDNSGIFVHGAPWSTAAQGSSNVSHGCINLSPANAEWFYDTFGSGDPVVIKNTDGGWYTQQDGAHDWQLF